MLCEKRTIYQPIGTTSTRESFMNEIMGDFPHCGALGLNIGRDIGTGFGVVCQGVK